MSIFITGPVRIKDSVLFNTTNTWAAVGAAGSVGAALSSYGELYVWGLGTGGALGDNTVTAKSSPVQVGGQQWIKVVGGRLHWLGLRKDGSLWAWGNNGRGQLGQSNLTHRSSPVQIGTSSWANIGVNTSSSYAVRADGTMWAWGDNGNYQLGIGNDQMHRSSPVQVGTDTNWLNARFANDGNVFLPFTICMAAIKSDGSLWQWGAADYGELAVGVDDGLGTIIASTPLQVGTSSWMSVGLTSFGSAAIRADGALFTWGPEDLQRVDYIDGTGASRSSPVQVSTSSWTSIAGSGVNGMFAAIRADGILHTWGYDAQGSLGTNAPPASGTEIPTPILSNRSWTQVACGTINVYALATDNTIWAWGGGASGRNGDITVIPRSSPVQVAVPALVS